MPLMFCKTLAAPKEARKEARDDTKEARDAIDVLQDLASPRCVDQVVMLREVRGAEEQRPSHGGNVGASDSCDQIGR